MAFDEDKDKVLKPVGKITGCDGTTIHVDLCSYDGGAAKLAMVREVTPKKKAAYKKAVGRLTLPETIQLYQLLDELDFEKLLKKYPPVAKESAGDPE